MVIACKASHVIASELALVVIASELALVVIASELALVVIASEMGSACRASWAIACEVLMAMACEVSIFAALLSSLVLDHGEALAAGDVKMVEALLIFLIAFPLAAIGPLSLWQLANEGGFDNLAAISQRLSFEAISKRVSETAASKGSSGAPPLEREERASSTQQPTQSHSSV